jgi:hypothetical protein
MIQARTHTLTIRMMANASTTAAFSGGKVSPDAATTSSAERPPLLIACRRSFPVGFNPVMFISLVLLVPIVAFAFMMMVVDNRNGERQLIVETERPGQTTTKCKCTNSISMSKFLEWRISTQLRLPLPTQQSLAYDDVEHPPGVGLPSYARLLPTANPSFVNPKRSTSPPPLPVYQRATVRWRCCMLRCLYARPPPSLMARVRQFTIPAPTKAPPIPIVASPPSVHRWGTVRWRGCTLL